MAPLWTVETITTESGETKDVPVENQVAQKSIASVFRQVCPVQNCANV